MAEALDGQPEGVRCVLVPLHGMQLLLPNAAVAEVIDYTEPKKLQGYMPGWLLGHIAWRYGELYATQLEALLQHRDIPTVSTGQRIVVCHTLNPRATRPFVGIVSASIPRLIRVQENALKGLPLEQHFAQGMLHAHLSVDGVEAYIPHLEAIEQRVAEVV